MLFPPTVASEQMRITLVSSHFHSKAFIAALCPCPRLRPTAPSLSVWKVRLVCLMCGQDGGQRLQSPRGSGQQPWQERAVGCLAVDFLWCRWGWELLVVCAVEHMLHSLPLEFKKYVNADWRHGQKAFLCIDLCTLQRNILYFYSECFVCPMSDIIF